MLHFEPISLDMKNQVDRFYFEYGEGSCQHSFTTDYCMKSKYDDLICEHEGYLYVLRNGLSDSKNRSYLFPMGPLDDDRLKQAIDNIINDAHEHNQKVIFNSITENAKNKLVNLYKDKFIIEDRDDLYEYIYNVEDLANLNGPKYYNKRNEVRSFFRKHEDSISIKVIDASDVDRIKELSKKWLEKDNDRMINEQLQIENKALNLAFENYSKLGILGLAIYIGSDLAGFIIGVKLNEEYVDAMIEKGNIKYKGVYKVLNKEFSRICCKDYKYINLEEDLGIEGLRNMKKLYHPSHLIKKFVAKEI